MTLCSVCDGHGVLVAGAKGLIQASPCPACLPLVDEIRPRDPHMMWVTSCETGERHLVVEGVFCCVDGSSDVPNWLAFG